MNEYFSTEFLMGDNQYECTSCGTHRDAKKRFSIEKSPRVLIVQLRRTDKKGRKIKTHVEFPSTFSMTNFKSKSIDRIASGLPPLPVQLNDDIEIYDLSGFVEHEGE
jgi:ubiquitin C-terminal hydrolase